MTELQNGKYQLIAKQSTQGFSCTWNAISKNADGTETNCTVYSVDSSLVNDENHPEFVRLMTLEAKAIASVSHPSLPQMEFFVEDDSSYLVMQEVTGTNLKEILQQGHALAEDDAIRCFAGIVEALQEIHQLKAEHHNIQPKQIVIVEDPQTKAKQAVLTGFAPAIQITPKSTSSEQVQNAYVPYFDSKVNASRGAQDVYALAATMYYAVTGQVPESFWRRKLSDRDTLKSPIENNPRLSLKLNAAILQAMHLEANKRPLLRNWLDALPKELTSTQTTVQAAIQHDFDEKIAQRQVPMGWLLWSGTFSVLMSLLLSVTLSKSLTGLTWVASTRLSGLTWMALIGLTGLFGFTIAVDRTVSSWASVMSLALLGFILFVVSPVLPQGLLITAVVLLIAIAAYLTWRQEWYRLKDLQRAWYKLGDRTRNNLAGYPFWQRYGMLIATNWICLIIGRIIWGIAISQGLQQGQQV
ncbi:MAG: hypothetical protein LH649_06425 [Pseudanabaena sp. CAN_BIN31]|nr:hypothetical protein [Pseudanabaena sp. CAN_BIN31]